MDFGIACPSFFMYNRVEEKCGMHNFVVTQEEDRWQREMISTRF